MWLVVIAFLLSAFLGFWPGFLLAAVLSGLCWAHERKKQLEEAQERLDLWAQARNPNPEPTRLRLVKK